MKRFLAVSMIYVMPLIAVAQGVQNSAVMDYATVSIHRSVIVYPKLLIDPPAYNGAFSHPVRVVARHPKAGCAQTEVCGEIFLDEWTHNLRTSVGTTWQSQLMSRTTTPTDNNQANWMALTNTAITPAMADTALSGEIVANGLSRAQGTYTDSSGVISVPAAGTASVIGTTGATSYWYWVIACAQGICTTISAASNNITTSNATLSTTNYNQITFTGVTGATSYQILRTTSSSAPTGTVSDLVGNQAFCTAALACTVYDQSNTLASVTIAASNLTNYGHYALAHTWTCTTSAQSAQAFGILSASSGGTLAFEGTFTQAILNVGDTLTLTETVNF